MKCIYIDPPYNTGNEGWVYNDNVNSPEIRKWLGETVGKRADDAGLATHIFSSVTPMGISFFSAYGIPRRI